MHIDNFDNLPIGYKISLSFQSVQIIPNWSDLVELIVFGLMTKVPLSYLYTINNMLRRARKHGFRSLIFFLLLLKMLYSFSECLRSFWHVCLYYPLLLSVLYSSTLSIVLYSLTKKAFFFQHLNFAFILFIAGVVSLHVSTPYS